MPKLTIVRGVSGSGKSTWANNQNATVVSRDQIRLALLGTAANFEEEQLVTFVEHAAIEGALRAGKDVISDNTSIEWKFVKALAGIGHKVGAEVELKVFDVSLADCIKRNEHRAMLGGRHVPIDVIKRQHERFQKTKNLTLEPVQEVVPYFPPCGGAPKVFLVDIDGTLAHMNDKRGPFDWKRVGLDDVDEVIADVVDRLRMSYETWSTLHCIVMSGRDESCREETERWLHDAGIPFDELFMRPEGDMRKDNIVKAELFDKYVRDQYDVRFVIDDRWQVCEMWLKMGLKVLNVSGLDRGEF